MSEMNEIEKPIVRLSGTDGNAFSLMGKVRSALQKSGYSKEHISKFLKEATSGDYTNLISVCCEYVEVE